MEKVLIGVLVTLTVSVIGIIGWMFYEIRASNNSPTFELRKDQWNCVETRTVTYTTHVLVGKVMVPQYHTSLECINYVRK